MNNYRKSPTELALKYLPYVPVLILAFAMIMPYYWMLIGAFKPLPELRQVPPTFYVQNPTLDNFYDPLNEEPEHTDGLFQRYESTQFGFMRFYGNSIFIAVINTTVGLLIASMSAYVFAKHQFPGRNVLFLVVLASMMMPWQVTLIPNFLTVTRLGWLDTYWAMIIPAIPRAFALFFLRQYMMSLPDDLIDAAKVDGANHLRIWWQVIVPLTLPAMVAMGLFMYLGEWNNLVWPLVVLRSNSMQTLPIVLATMIDPFSPATEQGVMMVAALLVSLPTLIMFLFFQKQFVRGIAMSGLKG